MKAPSNSELTTETHVFFLRTDVDFEKTLYAKACDLIQKTPEKLSFDQVVKGLNLPTNEVDPEQINLALNWAQQAHKAYIRRR